MRTVGRYVTRAAAQGRLERERAVGSRRPYEIRPRTGPLSRLLRWKVVRL